MISRPMIYGGDYAYLSLSQMRIRPGLLITARPETVDGEMVEVGDRNWHMIDGVALRFETACMSEY